MSLDSFIKRNIFWFNDIIHGKKIFKHYSELKRFYSENQNSKSIQEKKLKDLLEYACKNSQFYSNYAGKSLSDFPVVNKKILIENSKLNSIDYKCIPEQETEKIHIQKTSGSTGMPFAIPQDSRKRYRRIAELKYYGETVGFKSHDKLAQCRIWTKWQSKGKWQSFKENIIPVNISQMDDKTLENICSLIEKKHVVSMRAYASWYDQLIGYIEKNNISPQKFKTMKVMISSSEALNDDTRVRMFNKVNVPIVECYANEENGVIAQQKIQDTNYYLNHSSYYFEFLKLDSDEPAEYGTLGRIVVTDLYNYAFPFIRYDTGDTGIVEKGNEKSGGWDFISKLYGRTIDLVYDVNSKPIQPMNFPRILKNFAGIVQWQVIQKTKNEYLLKINKSQEIDENGIILELTELLGEGSVIKFEYVTEIPVLGSGKRKPVVCEYVKC